MNGKTTIDAGLNPCSAAMDQHTYGCRALNISTYGKRLVRIRSFAFALDVYWSRWRMPFYARMRNAAMVFFPGGSIQWPMPDRLKGGE